jgi:tetratricopeptide (TPR) repeat protein
VPNQSPIVRVEGDLDRQGEGLFDKMNGIGAHEVIVESPRHDDTLATLNNLAIAYRAAGKLPEAIALHKQVRDAFVKKLGADHLDTLSAQHNLALSYRDAGKLPEAITLFEQVRDALVKKQGSDHPTP